MANAICERVIGTIRRECLDWLIPLSASHLQSTLKSWIRHYNAGRPHMALGPGVPDPLPAWCDYPKASSRRRHGESYAVRANPILESVLNGRFRGTVPVHATVGTKAHGLSQCCRTALQQW